MLRQALTVAAILFTSGCGTTEPYPLESSLEDFKAANGEAANSGYRQLSAGGERSIPLLLGSADLKAEFSGWAYQDTRSSLTLEGGRPAQGVVALYLIEVIRTRREYPHALPMLLGTDGTIPGDAQDRAAAAYRAWWSRLGSPTREQVRAAPDPLEGTGLRWR